MASMLILAPLTVLAACLLMTLGLYACLAHPTAAARQRLHLFTQGSALDGAGKPSGWLLAGPASFSNIPALDRLLKQVDWGKGLSRDLGRADLPLKVGEYLAIRCLLAMLLGFEVDRLSSSLLLGLAGAAAGFALPALYVRGRKKRRLHQFDDQLVDALVLIANALKSGYSFLQGMQAIADEMRDPIAGEFRRALNEARLGAPVDQALMGIIDRVPSEDFGLVVTAIITQRQVGGNLTEVLSSIVHTVRERHRILREVRVLTAQERMSGYVIAALPVFLIVVLSVISPNYVASMWQDHGGKILLAAAFVMETLGLLVIRRIVDIEV